MNPARPDCPSRCRDGLPYCEADYHSEFGIRCDGCEKYITGHVLEVSEAARAKPCAGPRGLPAPWGFPKRIKMASRGAPRSCVFVQEAVPRAFATPFLPALLEDTSQGLSVSVTSSRKASL